MGISLVADRKHFSTGPPFLFSGIMYIISGSSIVSYLLSFCLPIGWILLSVATLLSAIALFGTLPTLGKIHVGKPEVFAPERPLSTFRHDDSRVEFCPYCGRRTEGAIYCRYCGKKVAP